MNNRFLNLLLAFLFLTGLCCNADAQNDKAEAKLQQYTIRIGDQTKLFLSVNQRAKELIAFPKLEDTITGKIQIVSVNKPDTVYDQQNHNLLTVTQSYTITCFDAGTYTIPSFSVGTPSGILKTNELTLQVETVKVDTTKGIYDIKQPLRVSYTWMDWLRDNWYWVVLPLIAISLIGGLLWYFKTRPKAEPVVQQPKSTTPPHILALNQLKELKDKKLWQQDKVKQYYIELSDIIREYLEKRFLIKTHEKTTDEIFIGLRNTQLSNINRNKLKQLLTLSDLVKFAKEKPVPDENDQSMDAAIDFISATKLDERSLSKEEGNVNV